MTLPAKLMKPFLPMQSDGQRVLAWNDYELGCWREAMTKGLSMKNLPPDIQRAILAKIDDREIELQVG